MVGSDDILSADRIAAVGKMAVVFDKWFPGKKINDMYFPFPDYNFAQNIPDGA